MNGQVLDSIELRKLGGASFEKWLGAWRERWLAGERIAILVDRDSTHAVVIEVDA